MIIADIANRVHTGVLPFSTGGKGDPTDHAVGVDVGDLCAELDQRIGEPIERAVGRYLDRQITRHIRENVVRDLAEKIITYDRVIKESSNGVTKNRTEVLDNTTNYMMSKACGE